MHTKKLIPILLACLTLLAWKPISIHQNSVRMASYNAPENTLEQYKSLERRSRVKENDLFISDLDEIFGNKVYL